jgi:hypothetical protein
MKACDLSNPPQWYSEFDDELKALTLKYATIAQAEQTPDVQVMHSFIAIFTHMLIAAIPDGGEQGIIHILIDFFNETRPGWNT